MDVKPNPLAVVLGTMAAALSPFILDAGAEAPGKMVCACGASFIPTHKRQTKCSLKCVRAAEKEFRL